MLARLRLLVLLLVVLARSADAADWRQPFAQAQQAFAAHKPRAARDLLADAIRADPRALAPHLLQTRVFLALGDGVAAEAELDRAAAAGLPRALGDPLRGEAALLQDDAARALGLADPRRAAPSERVYATRIRGRALVALGDFAGASRAFDQALATAPNDAPLWVDVGRFRLATGDARPAVDAADRAVTLAPALPEALVLKGEITRIQYGLRAALPWFDRALASQPDGIPALLAKAATAGELGQARLLLALTRKVIALDAANPRAFFLQAALAARAGQFGLARRLLDRTGGTIDDEPATMLLDGVVELSLGNTEQAIERLQRLIATQPDNARARRILAAAQWRAGDPRSALATLQPVVDGDGPPDSYALVLAGRALERIGDRARAAVYLDRAFVGTAAPRPLPAPEELDRLRREHERRPVDGLAGTAYVRALIDSGRAEDAVAVAGVVGAANPGAPPAQVLLGDALLAAGRSAEAAQAYRQAANTAFDEPTALRLIAALRAAGDGRAALQVLNIYLAQHPRSVGARLLAAEFLGTTGRWSQAGEVLDSLRRQLGARDAVVLNNQAWALLGQGRAGEAVKVAADAYRLAPASPIVADTLGWMLFVRGGSRDRAVALLEQAWAQAPESALVRAHLVRAYRAADRELPPPLAPPIAAE